jgi:uncharacterized delta-60 repeat protein
MKKILFLVLSLCFSVFANAQDGSIDTSFNPTDTGYGNGANSTVNSTAIQTDGKTIIGGYFTTYNGATANFIARLNTDGTLDSTFTTGTGANNVVSSIAIQSDGKIIIGGDFTTYNGTSANYITRLNTDGSLDTTFSTGTGINSYVLSTTIQANGKIIIGGNFTNFDGTTANRIVRLNTDGSLDTTFVAGTGANGTIYSTAIQTDGKIIISGGFSTYNGTTANCIARLNTDGTLDNTFTTGAGANNFVYSTKIQTNGKIIIGGYFTTYDGTTANRIARLNTDGTLDSTFTIGTGADSLVWSITIQADGKIIIGGDFATYNGTTVNRIARLNTDGTLDNTFTTGTGANNIVYSIAIQSDGKIIVGGNFTTFNGNTIIRIFRINIDGTLDGTFTTVTGVYGTVYSSAIQSDGKIIIGGNFTRYNGTTVSRIARLNTNGTLDNTFTSGTGTNNTVSTIAIQADGKIIIGGFFTMYNGASANRFARLNTDGTLDAAFSVIGTNSTVFSTAIQSDGKIIMGGDFTIYNGTTVNRIVRLNTDGSLDTTFITGLGVNSTIRSITIQNDGKIIIVGNFTMYNGITASRIARLDTNGILDSAFTTGSGVNGIVYSSAIQSDGKIIIGGNFTTYNGATASRIARLNTNGTLDSTFASGTGANGIVRSTTIQADGKTIIGGYFTTYNGTMVNYITRLNTDGTLDPTFAIGTGANSTVFSTAIQSDGKIIIGGDFTGYNGTGRNRVARIKGVESNIWNGTVWSLGTPPTLLQNACISGNYTSFGNGGSINANTLTVNNNAVVIISSGDNVSMNAALTVSSGSFNLDNNANLIQSTNAANTGNINVKRNTAPLMRQDYVLWSSPVAGQQLQSFSPMTLATRFYTYNPATNLYATVATPAATNFVTGKGYLIRMPNDHPVTPTIWSGTFTGTPTNGHVYQSVANATYNAIGNPYPSTINADAFITANGITEALYFWRKTNNAATTSYATYTLAGGVGTGSNSGDPLGLVPNGIIQVGQGFIAKSTSTNLLFTNAMRVVNNADQFLKTAEDRSRLWLNLTNAAGMFSQTMVAYMPNATQGIDAAIDGRFFNDSQTALTTIIDSEEFAIQGRTLPFDASDVVSLGFKSELAGNYAITLDHFDGLFAANQDVFLRDNLTNTVQNLKTANYDFATTAGVFNSRFEIIYQNPLSVNSSTFNENGVVVYKNNGLIHINTGAVMMDNVKLFDISGRLVFEKSKVNATETVIDGSKYASQVLIVQITSDSQIKVSKKIVN